MTAASPLLALVLTIALLASAAPASSGGPPYLAVTSVTPAANTLDVSAGANVTVEFDYAVNGATLTQDTFNVDGSLSGKVDGTYSGGGTAAITFDPTSDFEAGETVTVTLTLAIEGLDGRTLEYPVTWQFVVETSHYGYFAYSGQSLGSSTSHGVSLGDLDGDGDLDAFVANYGANRVWLNDGSGYFTDSGQSLGSYRARGVSLGDLDGDGDLDAFVANQSHTNRVWLNDGDGYFTDSLQSLGSSMSNDVSLGDLDGDGDLDAFVANYDNFNRVWLNDGTGTFTDSGQSLGMTTSRGVSLGDPDGDGDLDAFVANYWGLNSVWLNDGYGNFTDSLQSLGSSLSRDVSLGDLDGDGDLDAFVANYDDFNWVWLNDGTGTFTDSGQSLGSSTSHGVSLGDLDGDGDLDAFVANYLEPNRVWLNDGGGNLTDSEQTLGSAQSWGVSLGDLDGDGDLDAFVANSGSNRVWLNFMPHWYEKGYQDGLEACADAYIDVTPPSGSVHAHDNFLWTRNGKTAEVTLSGYVRDELSIARDGGGIGISSAYLLIDGTDKVTLPLDPDGTFEVTRGFTCSKGTVYTVELHAADTTPAADGSPNSGLVDSTCVRVR